VIASDRQFHQARASLQSLRDALATEQLESSTDQDVAPELRDAAIASIQAQIDDLAAEITQFEDLKAGRVQTLALTGLLDLPDILIGARIAAGLTQSELAERIGVSQQQVQQDEAGGYSKASLERVQIVAALLDVVINGQAQLPPRGYLRAIPSRDELIAGQVSGSVLARSSV
jgi:HTH-type transcriptional regulator/antitoxin HigA